jgi:alkylhydroperoxidase family enzyme
MGVDDQIAAEHGGSVGSDRCAAMGVVPGDDPFPRRTATPSRLLPWLVELARTAPGLGATYGLRRTLDARTRERLMLAVTEVNGCRYCAWIHGSWQEFLGDRDDDGAVEDALLAYGRAAADAGRPLDAAGLERVIPAEAVTAVRATVAQIEVSNLVGNTVDGLLARLTRKRPWRPLDAAMEAGTVALALPVALPLLAGAAAMKALERAAPPLPDIELPPAGEANLLVHLLAEAAPVLLGNAAVRAGLLGFRAQLTVALEAGRTAATVRIGRGRVVLENGVAPDALIIVSGQVDALLAAAAGRSLAGLHLRTRSP